MDATASTPQAAKLPGTVITFYSFKGGVGRSMALANVAILLARAGKRVLCVDWDLEAPGLDRYFRAVPRSAPDKVPSLSEPAKRGGLLAILENSASNELVEWRDYVRVRTAADKTQLDFIGSGDDEEGYSSRLGAFSWTDFFARKGGDLIEELRNGWKQDYDFILIDSRTGLTDASGVCTIQLPDLVVMLFAANEQNVDWCERIARGIRNGRSKLPYDRTFLPIIPILSRFDAKEESDRASEAMDRIAPQFASFFSDWLPRSIAPRAMLAWSVLPYVARYSFEEALAVEDEPETGAQGLSFYYDLLARLILARFAGIRAILAGIGVSGAALPPLLPGSTELESELRQDVDAVERYATQIKNRAEEEPLEAAEALETLAAACASTSRLRDADALLTEAIAILSDPAIAENETIVRLKRKRAELAMRLGVFRKRFRIAFSFSTEKRAFIDQVAGILAKTFGESKILYDAYHQAEFARANLSMNLPELYYKHSDLVVAFISSRPQSGNWSGLEWTALYDLLMQRRNAEVMLCRFSHAEVPGLPATTGFVELDDKTPEQTAELIMERLALNEGRPRHYYTASAEPIRSSATPIPNNLPRLQPFFGRTKELKQIADALDPESRTWGALIDGPSGIGKTSLAVRAAYDCPLGQFQRIIFLSVKDPELNDDGERQRGGFILPGFLAMLNELARELGQSDITKAPETDRTRLLLAALVPAQALLILDNLESLTKEDREELLSFIKRLPQGCKAILTSRRRIGSGSELLILEKLDEAAALEMLADLAKRNPLLAKTSEEDRRSLYEQTGGVPLLLHWTAGQLGRGSIRTVPEAIAFLRSCPPSNNPLEFMFGDLADEFSAEETRVLAMLTYFTSPARVQHIATSAGMSEETVEIALRALANRSVVVPDQEEQSFVLVPMVADFLRRKRPEVVAETGQRLEQQAYSLIVEHGYVEYDQFPRLDEFWPTVAPALRLFIDGPNPRLQSICEALKRFLDFTGRWDEWLSLTQQAEVKAVSVGDLINAGWRAYESGAVHSRRLQGDAVLACAERAATHWQMAGAGDRERAAAIRLRGIGHQLNKDYDTAIVAYREALALGRNLSAESADIAIGLNWLANAEKESGNIAAAEQNYRESLRVSRAGSYEPLIATATKNLAELSLLKEDWTRAEALARDALPLSEKVGRHELIADDCHRLAKALVGQGRLAEALPYARRALEIYTQLNLPVNLEAARETLEESEAKSSTVSNTG